MHINQTFELKNGNRKYNYFKCMQYLQQQGRVLYGSSYHIHPSQQQQLYRMLLYATGNKESVLYGIDLKKGLLVTGLRNSGKTGLIHLLKPFFLQHSQYLLRSSREVAFCYERFGKNSLKPYMVAGTNYCFDDLGMEPMEVNTKNNYQIMKELLQFRIHASHNTHIITPLNKTAIAEKYGKDFRNMLYHNLNYIEFTTTFY